MMAGYCVSSRVAADVRRRAVASLTLIWYDACGREVARISPGGPNPSMRSFLHDACERQKKYDFLGMGWSCPELKQLLDMRNLYGM